MYYYFFYYSRVGLDENDISQYYETISIHTESSQTNVTKTKTSDSITRIYACATMWHETQGEMLEMLKSIFRYVFPRILAMYTVIGLYRTSFPVLKSGKFSKSGLFGNQPFSFQDARLSTLLKRGHSITTWRR